MILYVNPANKDIKFIYFIMIPRIFNLSAKVFLAYSNMQYPINITDAIADEYEYETCLEKNIKNIKATTGKYSFPPINLSHTLINGTIKHNRRTETIRAGWIFITNPQGIMSVKT